MKVSYLVHNYKCEQCDKFVTKEKADLHCPICGKKLCKTCMKNGVCSICSEELPDADYNTISRKAGKNRLFYYLFISPIIAFPIGMALLIFGGENPSEVYQQIYMIILGYAFTLIWPATCGLIKLGQRYQKVYDKVAVMPLPTYEGFAMEFMQFFESRKQDALSELPKKMRYERGKALLFNDQFVGPLIQEFVERKAQIYPDFKDRILKSCVLKIKYARDTLKAYNLA